MPRRTVLHPSYELHAALATVGTLAEQGAGRPGALDALRLDAEPPVAPRGRRPVEQPGHRPGAAVLRVRIVRCRVLVAYAEVVPAHGGAVSAPPARDQHERGLVVGEHEWSVEAVHPRAAAQRLHDELE